MHTTKQNLAHVDPCQVAMLPGWGRLSFLEVVSFQLTPLLRVLIYGTASDQDSNSLALPPKRPMVNTCHCSRLLIYCAILPKLYVPNMIHRDVVMAGSMLASCRSRQHHQKRQAYEDVAYVCIYLFVCVYIYIYISFLPVVPFVQQTHLSLLDLLRVNYIGSLVEGQLIGKV